MRCKVQHASKDNKKIQTNNCHIEYGETSRVEIQQQKQQGNKRELKFARMMISLLNHVPPVVPQHIEALWCQLTILQLIRCNCPKCIIES